MRVRATELIEHLLNFILNERPPIDYLELHASTA
jgi:hypothetical protein